MKTILVADDKANIRNLVRDYLEDFRVVIAADGREALYSCAGYLTRSYPILSS
jgi:CheY-like chemotaxis protein